MNFYLSLLEIQSKNILELDKNWLLTVNDNILDRLSKSILAIQEKIKLFFDDYILFQNNIFPPITDLTKYLDEKGCIQADIFLQDFLKQMNTNLGGLEKLDDTKMKPSLINISLIVKSCTKYNYDIGSATIEMLKNTLLDLNNYKATIKENLEFMQARYEQSENSLTVISIDCFRFKAGIVYFQHHEEALVSAFTNPPKEFPIRVPNLINQSENLLEIRNEIEYQKVKVQFNHFNLLNVKYKKLISMIWPASEVLPNLSTHEFTPRLTCGSPEEFESIVNVYLDYLKRLETMKTNWSTTLRNIVNTVESLNDLFPKQIEIIHQF